MTGPDQTPASSPAALLSEISSKLRPSVALPDMIFGFMIDNHPYCITINNTIPSVSAVTFLPPWRAVTIHMSSQTLLDIMAGRLDPAMGYLSRKIRIDGKVSVAKQIGDLFV